MPVTDARARLQAVRELLETGAASTQEELREQLERLDYQVTQSTISRDLKRLGAIKATDAQGRTTYRLSTAIASSGPFVESLADLVTSIRHNGQLIVMKTTPGSASLVAHHIDGLRSTELLGTIAGDDTIFVAPSNPKDIQKAVKLLQDSIF